MFKLLSLLLLFSGSLFSTHFTLSDMFNNGVPYSDIMDSAMEYGFNPDQADASGLTLLILACQRNNEVGVYESLQAGANINKADKEGKTPLMHAAESGNWKIINVLLSRKANATLKDKYGKTAKDYASTDLIRAVLD